MEAADRTFYYIKTTNIVKKIKILEVSGDNVKYQEMKGYVLIDNPAKRVFVSKFSLIENYKRNIRKADLSASNIFKKKFIEPIIEVFYAFIEDFQIFFITFFKIIGKIILLPILPFYLIYEVVTYKMLINFFDRFQTLNKDETEYLEQ
jgi:hypothetical protein